MPGKEIMRYKRVLYLCLLSLCLLCGCTKKEELIRQSGQALESNENLEESGAAGQDERADESTGQWVDRDVCKKDGQEAQQEEKAADSGTGGMAEDAGTIYVHVCGAVLRPGVYELAAGSRVYEAVQAAGGFAENAEESYVNQAQEVPDGAKLVIPTKEEAEAIVSKDSGRLEGEGQAADSGLQPGIAVQEDVNAAGLTKETEVGKTTAEGGRVNINTASLEELCKIPGIGTTRAAAIVSYREDHGSFKSPEEIMQVSGIKEGTYEKIKDSISVK